jgi:hypothetical protein
MIIGVVVVVVVVVVVAVVLVVVVVSIVSNSVFPIQGPVSLKLNAREKD